MISKLDAITFWGIKNILDHRLDEDLGELAFRIMSVIRSLKGGQLSEGGIRRNLMELSRMKDVIDDILAIRGIGTNAGELPFDEAMQQLKRQRLSEKARISKKVQKQASGRKKPLKTARRKARVQLNSSGKAKARGKTRGKRKVQKNASRKK